MAIKPQVITKPIEGLLVGLLDLTGQHWKTAIGLLSMALVEGLKQLNIISPDATTWYQDSDTWFVLAESVFGIGVLHKVLKPK